MERFLNWWPLELVHHQGPKLEAAQKRPTGLRTWGLREAGLWEATEDCHPESAMTAGDLHLTEFKVPFYNKPTLRNNL